MKKWGFHACSPWSGDCAMQGVRLNIHTPWWFAYVALTPEGRVYRGRHPDGKWVWIEVRREER